MASIEPPMLFPDLADPDHAGFWEGTAVGEMRVKNCAVCGRDHWPPRLGCVHCGAPHVAWRAVRGLGHLYSWTVSYRAPLPGMHVPYVVLLVELEDAPGVRMIGNAQDLPLSNLHIGMLLRAVFHRPVPDAAALVAWTVR